MESLQRLSHRLHVGRQSYIEDSILLNTCAIYRKNPWSYVSNASSNANVYDSVCKISYIVYKWVMKRCILVRGRYPVLSFGEHRGF